jgi:hypothetical protein
MRTGRLAGLPTALLIAPSIVVDSAAVEFADARGLL